MSCCFRVGSCISNYRANIVHYPPSKSTMFGFAICIILLIGSLAMLGVGIDGIGTQKVWVQGGFWSHLDPYWTLTLMGSIGVVGFLAPVIIILVDPGDRQRNRVSPPIN